jgi:hypothetical protein
LKSDQLKSLFYIFQILHENLQNSATESKLITTHDDEEKKKIEKYFRSTVAVSLK